VVPELLIFAYKLLVAPFVASAHWVVQAVDCVAKPVVSMRAVNTEHQTESATVEQLHHQRSDSTVKYFI
jgi:hypothetical protein